LTYIYIYIKCFYFYFSWQWFEQFPEFQANPFYVAGESYAGIYVPTLVFEIAKGNDID
jgi:serine carboxypeptidase-like clade 1